MTSSIPSLGTSLDEYVTRLKTETDKSAKAAGELPQDIPFHRTLDRKFRAELDATSARVLRLTDRLLRLAETLDIQSRSVPGRNRDGSDKVALVDEEDVMDRFHSVVVDVFDPLLEHVDHCLDVHGGRIQPPKVQITVPKEDETGGDVQKAPRLPQRILHAHNLPKPQLRFADKVDNSNDLHWSHRLSKKWHSKEISSQMGLMDNEALSITHPYSYEITNLQYNGSLFTSRRPIPPKSFVDTPFSYIDSKEGLFLVLDKLRQAEEIAIDLEHHSYRSYYGFVCLMQISTRNEDIVVDCLVPDIRENLEVLNEVFTDPSKLKILHGAESDIVWLQENFNLYIVNLFDTFHASKVLDLPRHSLAFLLSVYCDFTADKRYQLADWRIRPLPSEMVHYARSDTHFLLFVYDQLREALIERSKVPGQSTSTVIDGQKNTPPTIQTVLKYSAETSLREFVRERYDAENGEGLRGWSKLIRKWNKPLLFVDSSQRRVFLAVHKWRDQIAREEDESPAFVISNHALLSLIEKPAPDSLVSLYSSFPGAVPPLIRKRGAELLQVMQDTASKFVTQFASDALEEDQPLSIAVDTSRHVVFSAQPTPVPDLWDIVSMPARVVSAKIASSKSSLLGTVMASSITSQKQSTVTSTPAKLSTRHSAFLGSGSFTTTAKTARPGVPAGGQLQQKIAKIHEGILKGNKKVITIQNQVAKVKNAESGSSVTLQQGDGVEEPPDVGPSLVLTPLPEVAFVPRSQRLIAKLQEDEIVQVGQRKKKRKRAEDAEVNPVRRKRPAPDAEHDQEEKETTPELQVFDYSAGPNILDEGMKDVDDSSGGRRGRQGRKDADKGKGARLDFKVLGFGPPPKRMNDPKSGNKSVTFR